MAVDHTPLQHLLGYRLARASVPMDKVFNEAIGLPLQLRRIEFSLLSLIQANPGVMAKQLTQALSLSASNMSVVLDRLEKRGLVLRVASGADRRSWLLELSPAGKTLLNQAASVALDMEQRWLATRLSPAELGMLLELLDKATRPVAAGEESDEQEDEDERAAVSP